MNEPPSAVRLDKWLWAARVYKTRSQAATACDAGHVKLGDQRVKPSRSVHPGEVITARVGEITRTLKVVALLAKRVGPKLVAQYVEDLTPAEEYAKPRMPVLEPLFHRPKGLGRPTKRDRRLLEQMGGGEPPESSEPPETIE
jgi:ribosome-associated heat shock protein Hsp15